MQQPTVRPAPGDPARPAVDIGAGPAGLAAAADLRAYDLLVLVLEAGDRVGAAMRAWGHVRTFTSRDLTPLADPTAARGEVSGMEDCCNDLQGCDTGCC